MSKTKGKELSVSDYVVGVLSRNRVIISRTIALVESEAAHHQEKARKVLEELMPHIGGSIRVGVTGIPGAGKGTFVESLGVILCEQGKTVAVLPVDLGSSVRGKNSGRSRCCTGLMI